MRGNLNGCWRKGICRYGEMPPRAATPLLFTESRSAAGYADTFNITDNQTAIVRMSSIAAAV